MRLFNRPPAGTLARPGNRLLRAGLLWLLAGPALANSLAVDGPAAAASSLAPAPQPASGRQTYEAACSACHGAGGRGGRNGAPDLLASAVVAGPPAAFAAFVRAGVPERGMPPFALDEAALTALQAHLKDAAQQASRRGARSLAVVGDAGRGQALFHGDARCVSCHSVQGDLRDVGARYSTRVLQGRIVLPRGSGVHPGLAALGVKIPGVTDTAPVRDGPVTVHLQWPDGRTAEGRLLALSDFHVAWRPGDGPLQSAARRGAVPRVTVNDPAQAHIDRLGQLSDAQLHDLTAYLATLK